MAIVFRKAQNVRRLPYSFTHTCTTKLVSNLPKHLLSHNSTTRCTRKDIATQSCQLVKCHCRHLLTQNFCTNYIHKHLTACCNAGEGRICNLVMQEEGGSQIHNGAKKMRSRKSVRGKELRKQYALPSCHAKVFANTITLNGEVMLGGYYLRKKIKNGIRLHRHRE